MQPYELDISALNLVVESNKSIPLTETLASGRANYILFETLVRKITGLLDGSGCDHTDESGLRYEQKAYPDPRLYPTRKDTFQVSASSTFPANNNGPRIKRLLEEGDYAGALEVCKTVKNGYNSNDFYILTNTSDYRPEVPFRYFVISSSELMKHLSESDPREVSKESLFSVLKAEVIRLTWNQGVFEVG